MGSVLSACAASCVCTACCSLAGCACFVSSRVACFTNVAVLVGATFGAMALRGNTGTLAISWLPVCTADTCGGIFGAYRVNFALTGYFTALCLLTVGTTEFGAKLHRGWWWAKTILLMALLGATLFVSNESLAMGQEVARFGSIAFLFAQPLLLISLGHNWNEAWVEADGDEPLSCLSWRAALLLVSATMYGGSAMGCASLLRLAACPVGVALGWATLVLLLGLSGLSMASRICPHGNLLTSALLSLYATHLGHSALSAHTDAACSPSDFISSNFTPALGLAFAVAALGSAGWSGANPAPAPALLPHGVTRSDATMSQLRTQEVPPPIGAEAAWPFYLVCLACSLYLWMLTTDWSTQPAATSSAEADNAAAFWVLVSAQWAASGLYAYTLLAPYLLRHVRDFGVTFED